METAGDTPGTRDGAAPFAMRLAGLTIAVHPLHAQARELCRDYLIPEADAAELSAADAAPNQHAATQHAATQPRNAQPAPVHPDIVVEVSPADIARERAAASEPGYSDAYLETLAIYRAIAERGAALGRFLFHAAVIELDGKAYAFAAPSGTGKSTHVALWRKYLGERVQVINGDKPILELTDNAVVAYGTPWCGKEGWNRNASAPLAGLCLLERGDVCRCRRVSPAEALDATMRQLYIPEGAQAAAEALGFLDALLTRVPTYRLSCDISEAAVSASLEAMTGRGIDERQAPARRQA